VGFDLVPICFKEDTSYVARGCGWMFGGIWSSSQLFHGPGSSLVERKLKKEPANYYQAYIFL